MEITKEDIILLSMLYNREHRVTEEDVKKANELKRVIESTRMNRPRPGDIVIAIGPAKTYENGHIDREVNEYSAMCVRPSIPFVSSFINKDGKEQISLSTSGGYWFSVNNNNLKEAERHFKYEGKRKKKFKAWGHCGACGDGAFTFEAEVNVWGIFLTTIY